MSIKISPSRGRGMALALAAVLGASCLPVHAYNPFGRGDKDSTALINARTATGPLTTAELAVILLADPPVSELSQKSIVLDYNPGRFVFKPAQSGLLCEFAVGASCPAALARYGSFLVADEPKFGALQFGTPLPGSSLEVVHDAVQGRVSVFFNTPVPLLFETPGDRNWFAFYFETLVPYNPYQTLVTYHAQPGAYDFMQVSASCDVATGCGSDVPVYGVSLTPVPEPASAALWLAGLAGLTARRCKRQRR